ncbi:MAG: hypothetical protein WCD57_22055 [Acidobacteriaceae bacterium]
MNLFVDRLYFRDKLLPLLLAEDPRRILFLGVRLYTKQYVRIIADGGRELWTLDRDPTSFRCGSDNHLICDITDKRDALGDKSFDLIVYNGLIGWGVNSDVDITLVYQRLETHLAPKGKLLVGWNHDRSKEPMSYPVVQTHFQYAFETTDWPKVGFDTTSHCYDLFKRQ